MKILKKGNRFVAYRDENDTNMNPDIKVGDKLGHISIKGHRYESSGSFCGNTVCLIPLKERLRKYQSEHSPMLLPARMVMMSHLSDLSMLQHDTESFNNKTNFVKFLLLKYQDTSTEIDAEHEWQLMLKRKTAKP